MNSNSVSINSNKSIIQRQIREESPGHRLSIQLTSFSGDGQWFLSGDWQGAVKLWKFDNQELEFVSTVFFLDEAIEGLEFSNNNQFIGTGTESKLYVQEIENGNITNFYHVLPEASLRGGLFAFSPNNEEIAVITYDNTLIIANFKENLIIRKFEDLPSLGGSNCNTLAWIGDIIYVGLMNGTVGAYSSQTGEVNILEGGHTDSVLAVCSMNPSNLVSAGADGRIAIFNLETGKLLSRSEPFERPILTVDSALNSLIVYGTDREIFTYNYDSNENLLIKLTSSTNSTISIEPTGNYLIRGTNINRLSVFSAISGEKINELKGRAFSVTDAIITHSGSFVLCSGDDSRIHIFENNDSFGEINSLEGHSETVSGLALSSDDNYLISISYDDSVIIWETKTGKILKKIRSVELPSTVTYFTDGVQNLVVLGSAGDYSIQFIGLNGKTVYKNRLHEDYINKIIASEKEKSCYSISDDGKLIIWNNHGIGTILIKSYQGLSAISIDHTHGFIFLGGSESVLEVYDLTTLSLIDRFDFNEPITSISLNESDDWLIIGCQFSVHILECSKIPNTQPIYLSDYDEPIKKVFWGKNEENTFYSVTVGAGISQFLISDQDKIGSFQLQEIKAQKSLSTQSLGEDISPEQSFITNIKQLDVVYTNIRDKYEAILENIQQIATIIQTEVPQDQVQYFRFIVSSLTEMKKIIKKDFDNFP